MDSFIQREKDASNQIIQASTDLRGVSRDKIIQICESAYYRRYEDMLETISVSVNAKVASKFTLQINYFIEDSRIKWKPSIHVNIDKVTKKAHIEGYIMVWEEYANKWPEEIEKAQKGLNSRMSRGLFVYLLLEGQKTFSELVKDLDIDSNKLSYHLKSLVKNGLLTHTYAHEENRKDHSFYVVSNFGNIYAKKCLEAAYQPYQSQIPEKTGSLLFSIQKKPGQ